MAEQVTRTIIVKAPVEQIYALWANFENFPHFMKYIKSVRKTSNNLSHWVMEGPLGRDIEWDAETTRMEPNTRIAWNSRDNGDITTSGQVTFQGLAQGESEIAVTLQYVAPAGALGEVVAKLFSDPAGQLEEDLKNFKAYAEDTRSRTVGLD
jgi:uncharacterized membrane protein